MRVDVQSCACRLFRRQGVTLPQFSFFLKPIYLNFHNFTIHEDMSNYTII